MTLDFTFLPIITITEWLPKWSRPVRSVTFWMPFRLRPNTFSVANVTRSVRLTPAASVSVPSAFITVWMPLMPLTCWSASACRFVSVWLSPPKLR